MTTLQPPPLPAADLHAARTRFRVPEALKLLLALVLITLVFGAAVGFKKGRLFASEADRAATPLFDSEAALRFVSFDNLETISRQTVVVATAALGMTVVMILGGIDLAVGSVVALTGVALALVLRGLAVNVGAADEPQMGFVGNNLLLIPLLGVVAAMAVGALCGLFTGALVTGLKLVPFIVTLGMMGIVRGLAKEWAGNNPVTAPKTWLSDTVAKLDPEDWWHVFPSGVWLVIVLALLTAAFLRYTRIGRHVYAIGSNEQTARLCGVPVVRTKIIVYTLMGVMAGLAGALQFARLTRQGDPTIAAGLELDVIAAVVIGGGSLSGGEGSVFGSIVGALITAVISSGCSHMEWQTSRQQIMTGAIIIVAVALDRWRHRRAA